MTYLSFMIGLFLLIFILTLLFLYILLPILQKKHAGQVILEIGPHWHKKKEGTPTMGGIAPAASILLVSLVFLFVLRNQIESSDIYPFLAVLGYGLFNGGIGMVDDFTKLLHKENRGLTPLQKLFLQGGAAISFLLLLYRLNILSTSISIPFTDLSIPLGWGAYLVYFLFLLWFVNCANLTDGIDGLATSVATAIGVFFLLAGTKTDSLSLVLIGASLMGGGLGFYMYNKAPAKIFMGDTGSLFFGGITAGAIFLTASPLLFLLVGGIYLWEGVSVVLQVVWFKLSHGKRLFLMAPFHHHMEKKGWREEQITKLFFLLTLFFSLIAWTGVG